MLISDLCKSSSKISDDLIITANERKVVVVGSDPFGGTGFWGPNRKYRSSLHVRLELRQRLPSSMNEEPEEN